MGYSSNEINALLNLIEDPDEQVFKSITNKFISFGNDAIPILEEFSQLTDDPVQTEKIGFIMDSVSIHILKKELLEWKERDEPFILHPALAISSFLKRDSTKEQVLFEIEKIRKNIWLELNDYLTPLEEINIINKVVFEHFNIQLKDPKEQTFESFGISSVLFERCGSGFPVSAIYLIACELLGIPVIAAQIPNQLLLQYLDEGDDLIVMDNQEVLFYIDPTTGQVFTHNDIDQYLKKNGFLDGIHSSEDRSERTFIRHWIQEIARFAGKGGNQTLKKGLSDIASTL